MRSPSSWTGLRDELSAERDARHAEVDALRTLVSQRFHAAERPVAGAHAAAQLALEIALAVADKALDAVKTTGEQRLDDRERVHHPPHD
jgi:hypothetical protein